MTITWQVSIRVLDISFLLSGLIIVIIISFSFFSPSPFFSSSSPLPELNPVMPGCASGNYFLFFIVLGLNKCQKNPLLKSKENQLLHFSFHNRLVLFWEGKIIVWKANNCILSKVFPYILSGRNFLEGTDPNVEVFC